MVNIYGIYLDDICLYVGTTSRDYRVRCKEHFRALKQGKHENKSLQKEYDRYNAVRDDTCLSYRLIDSIDTDNTLLKYFYEACFISWLRPRCNKIVIQQGKSKVILQRTTQEIARELIRCIDDVCKEG